MAAITFEAYAKNNLCYKAAKNMPNGSPAGIIIHSTGCNNPNLWRYVDSPEICGKNSYGTHWNVPMPIGGNGKPTKISSPSLRDNMIVIICNTLLLINYTTRS